MTEQEAEAWVSRLTRIWRPEEPFNVYGSSLVAVIDKQQKVRLYIYDCGRRIQLLGQHLHLALSEDGSVGIYAKPYRDHPHKVQMHRLQTVKWLPFFRRGCYLSGLAIECSEHEKLEWTKWVEKEY